MLKNLYVLGLFSLPAFVCAEAFDKARVGVSDTELDKVQVTADPLGRSSNRLTQPVDILTDEAIRENQSAAIGELLSQQAGVHNASFGAAVGRPVIRGLSGARVKVMQNGIDSLDVGQISPDHAVTVDSQHAHQIEILRGPAALIYGSDAVGGAVNVVDNRIPSTVDENSSSVDVALSSVDSGHVLSIQNIHMFDHISTQFSLSTRNQGDYRVPHEHEEGHEEDHESEALENSAVEQNNVSAGIAYKIGDATFGLALSHMDHEFGLPGHGHEEDIVDPAAEEEAPAKVSLQQTRLDGTYTQLLSEPKSEGLKIHSLSAKFSIVDYQHTEGHEEAEEEVVVVDPADAHDHGGLTEFKRQALESRLQANYSLSVSQQGAFGVQLSHSQFSAHGGEAVVPSTDTTHVGLFALHSLSLTRSIEMELAGRIEDKQHSVDQSELDQDHLLECSLTVSDFNSHGFSNASVAAGLNQQGDSHTLRTNVMYVSRSPAVQELYSCGAHESSLSFEIGNPYLESEVSLGFDIGGQLQLGAWVIDASIYMTQVNDFIYQQSLGSQIDELDAYQYQQQNTALKGYEISAAYPINEALAFQVFSDDTIAKFTSGINDGEYVPRMPAQRIGVELSYQAYLWSAKIRNTRYLDQTRLSQFETKTKGFDLLSINAEYNLASASGELTLYSSLQNVLDEAVRYHTSFVKDEVLQPGRNVRVGVRYQF